MCHMYYVTFISYNMYCDRLLIYPGVKPGVQAYTSIIYYYANQGIYTISICIYIYIYIIYAYLFYLYIYTLQQYSIYIYNINRYSIYINILYLFIFPIYNIYIGNIKDSLRILNKMKINNIEPNTYTYNAIIKCKFNDIMFIYIYIYNYYIIYY